jgi:NAD(P)-dependent dehydrogenase (short-subunit alcohol dehydrogenase family)
MHDDQGVGEVLVRALEQREVSVLQISDRPSADELTSRLEGWVAEGAIDGVYWLTGLDPHADFTTLDYDAYKEAIRVRVKLLYTTMRALYEQIAGAGTFLVSAVRLGGQHGYDDDGAALPLGGAVTGFTKAYKREQEPALIKAVDFSLDADADAITEALISETLADPGVVEIGHKGGDRWTVGLRELPLDETQGIELDGESVFIVTGAAGSIVSAITGDLAQAAPGTFYLLDLTPEPDPNNDDLRRFVSDKDGLKRDIFERIKASGERATPKMVDRELAGLERQQSALAGIEAVRAAGGTAEYRSLNLMDGEAITKVVDEIREKHGRVDVLLHAAGLEISRFLPDKKPQEFDLVFDVKADGWFHLLSAIGDMPLKATVDWTAWAGIGMATRGSIPRIMEMAGIEMLDPAAGVPTVRRELSAGDFRGELLVAGTLGILGDEFDPDGGLDPARVQATLDGRDQPRMMLGQVRSVGLYRGLQVETTLDPQVQPFLFDHQIDGTPVLPGVMGTEAFGEVAKVLFPDWHVAAVEDVTFLAPFKFYRNQRRKLELRASFSRVAEGELLADCVLVGKRKLPNADEPVVTTHFAARVRLLKSPLPEETVEVPQANDGPEVEKQDIYQVYFHGPAYQVIEKAWRSNGSVVGLLPQDLPEDQKPEAHQEMLPRLIELCFQTAGLWEIGRNGKMGLPNRVEQVRVLRDLRQAEGRVFSVVTPREDGKTFDAVVADEAGHVFVKLDGYRTIELPGGVDEQKRKPLKSAME